MSTKTFTVGVAAILAVAIAIVALTAGGEHGGPPTPAKPTAP